MAYAEFVCDCCGRMFDRHLESGAVLIEFYRGDYKAGDKIPRYCLCPECADKRMDRIKAILDEKEDGYEDGKADLNKNNPSKADLVEFMDYDTNSVIANMNSLSDWKKAYRRQLLKSTLVNILMLLGLVACGFSIGVAVGMIVGGLQ